MLISKHDLETGNRWGGQLDRVGNIPDRLVVMTRVHRIPMLIPVCLAAEVVGCGIIAVQLDRLGEFADRPHRASLTQRQ